MKVVVFIALYCFIENAVDAGPTECYTCTDVDAASCSENQKNQICTTDPNSLGTTHCVTLAGTFQNQSKSGNEFKGFFRGCINCADKMSACYALGGALKASKGWILKRCELDCCTGNNCNTQKPTTSWDAIYYVFDPYAGNPRLWCPACLERDAATCYANQQSQNCVTDPNSLATEGCCASAMITYRDKSGKVLDGAFRGCLYCGRGDKIACYSLGGALKARKGWTLLKCRVKCCTTGGIPTLTQVAIPVFPTTAECHGCVESDAASCDENLTTQYCDTSDYSLGTTHCASAVFKYRNKAGNVLDGFVRGCANCADKKEACAAIGGNIKARKGWSLEKCDIDCCTGNDCNTQVPTLSADTTIPVFLPPASGPSLQCHYCLTGGKTYCSSNNQLTMVCKDDPDSLGTRHCYSAVVRVSTGHQHRYDGGLGFIRGCIDCTDKKAACAAVGGLLRERRKWKVLECEISCCTGDNCQTDHVTLPRPGNGGADAESVMAIAASTPTGTAASTPTGTAASTPTGIAAVARSSQEGLHVTLRVRALVFAVAFGNILYHF